MRLAEAIRLPTTERSALFYALLLKDVGCSSNAARILSLATTIIRSTVDPANRWTEPDRA